ncbi:CAAX protease [Anoxybacillus gonensis]|uniref:Predicted metal-dependent membrane protease, CAAX family n=2 Tax=Anoxybacillus TaxID=150247 RepID=B7GKY6_ANOFW|nr:MULTISPECIES: type II CAAX endopeptidase family protein [Anoxybacillus]AXM89127.1 CPBP family intramembrane metalloprotease [Anoxybacillus ayderensis G10]ACJ34964.1 Predicted metal-dependent membrane protease, CAAX family [Anoxybacillus flavithermus WK1]AKS39530.1 CAAX protease [Anoxybacillus gonensis]KGP60585.1 CAAX protease [Anoxybacillus gonensis]MBW9218564.1 CPBP family intramembrane metalloprotease [Anoxybacillus sp. ST70]
MSELLQKEQEQTSVIEGREDVLSWKTMILFFLSFFGMSFAVGFIFGIIGGVTNNEGIMNIFEGYMGLLFDALMFVAVLFLFKKVRVFLKGSFDKKAIYKGKTYLYIILAIFVTFVMQFLSFRVIGFENPEAQGKVMGLQGAQSTLDFVLIGLAVILVSPIKEELLFRGVLHRFLEKKYHFYVGLIVSSILFGLAHFSYPVNGAVIGIITVVLYRLTQSLYTSIFYHVIWNAFVFITILLS